MKILLILLLLIPINIFAIEKIQPHHPTYIIAGDKNNQVKYQVSIKYPLWYPYKSGIAIAYTQIAHWDLYDQSSPFRELNHNPEIFIERTNDIKFIDFYRIIPYTHISNGRDGASNRSVDAGAVEMQLSYGDFINFGIREKITCFYNLANQNKDYKRYRGNFETELFAQIKSRKGYFSHERLYIKGEWTKHFGWLECGLSTRIITTKFRPHIYIQYFYGYSEFLINYNQKTNALRAGFIFNPE